MPICTPSASPTRTHFLEKHVAQIRRLVKRTVEDVVEIGRLLTECKQLVGHGHWLPWLKREFGWSEATALNSMRVYELSQSRNFADLNAGLSIVYLLAAPATPEAALDEIFEQAATAPISIMDARAIINKHKEPKTPPSDSPSGPYDARGGDNEPDDHGGDDEPDDHGDNDRDGNDVGDQDRGTEEPAYGGGAFELPPSEPLTDRTRRLMEIWNERDAVDRTVIENHVLDEYFRSGALGLFMHLGRCDSRIDVLIDVLSELKPDDLWRVVNGLKVERQDMLRKRLERKQKPRNIELPASRVSGESAGNQDGRCHGRPGKSNGQ